jgi:catalase-peroxidase
MHAEGRCRGGAAAHPRGILSVPGLEKEKFVKDFVAVWTKVTNLDRFDLA